MKNGIFLGTYFVIKPKRHFFKSNPVLLLLYLPKLIKMAWFLQFGKNDTILSKRSMQLCSKKIYQLQTQHNNGWQIYKAFWFGCTTHIFWLIHYHLIALYHTVWYVAIMSDNKIAQDSTCRMRLYFLNTPEKEYIHVRSKNKKHSRRDEKCFPFHSINYDTSSWS